MNSYNLWLWAQINNWLWAGVLILLPSAPTVVIRLYIDCCSLRSVPIPPKQTQTKRKEGAEYHQKDENCALQGYYAASSYSFLLWALKTEPMDCPETSVRNCHYSLCNKPEERRYHLLRSGSLKSRTFSEEGVHGTHWIGGTCTLHSSTTGSRLPWIQDPTKFINA